MILILWNIIRYRVPWWIFLFLSCWHLRISQNLKILEVISCHSRPRWPWNPFYQRNLGRSHNRHCAPCIAGEGQLIFAIWEVDWQEFHHENSPKTNSSQTLLKIGRAPKGKESSNHPFSEDIETAWSFFSGALWNSGSACKFEIWCCRNQRRAGSWFVGFRINIEEANKNHNLIMSKEKS